MVLTGTFTWTQTTDEIVLSVPLKGAAVSSVDLYVSRLYMKVNYKPYLLNVDFWDEVDDMNGISLVDDGVLKIRLPKRKACMWPDLECENRTNKSVIRERRCDAMEEKQKRMAVEAEKLKERRMEDEKRSTRMQMQVDDMERQYLDDLKAEEKRQAEESVYETFKQLQEKSTPVSNNIGDETPLESTKENQNVNPSFQPSSPPVKGILKKKQSALSGKRRVSFSDSVQVSDDRVSNPSGDISGEDSRSQATVQKMAVNPPELPQSKDSDDSIFGEEDCISIDTESPILHSCTDDEKDAERVETAATSSFLMSREEEEGGSVNTQREVETEADKDLDRALPPPRSSARVQIAFTPRVFPTPMRESKREEEEDWLLRNRRHLKGKIREKLDGIDISERDPFWLKGKGDDFFRSGNFEGALNAYACALEVDPKMVSCMSNRAACFLKLNLYDRCIADCDEALSTLKAEREEEITLAQQEGFAELPKELKRTKDMRKKLHVRKGTSLSHQEKFVAALREYQLAQEIDPNNDELKADCARLTCLVQSAAKKDLGDAAFRSGDFHEATTCYTKALEFNPESIPAYSNRSACYLKLNNWEMMVKDCQRAVELLAANEVHSTAASKALVTNTQGPDAVSKPSSGLKLKLLLRLGKGLQTLNKVDEALIVLREALDLSPTDMKIAKQIKRIELETMETKV